MRSLSGSIKGVIFATEIAVRALIVPAAAITAMNSGNGIPEKTLAGVQAPLKLKEMISNIPTEIERTDFLVRTVDDLESIHSNEDDGWWEKIKQVKQIADERLPSIIQTLKDLGSKEFQHLSDLKQGVENFKNIPTETIASIILVIGIYLILAFGLRLIRLQDRDGFFDKNRKRFYQMITGKKSIEAHLEQLIGRELSEQEIITIMKLGISEYQKRIHESKK